MARHDAGHLDRKGSTKELYANLCRKHLEPEPFGATTLDRLRPTDVEGLVLALQTKGLSESTVRTMYTVLRGALDVAVRDGLVAVNPAALVKRPGVKRKEAKHLGADEVTTILHALQGKSRYYHALALVAHTGLRRGEALALKWSDVDVEKGLLKVNGTLGRVGGELVIDTPKTERSRRTVPLSAAVVTMLKKHRTTQKEDRLLAGNLWTNSGLVFTTETGGPIDPRNMLRRMQLAAKSVGLDAGVHTLRHSTARAMQEFGVHPKIMSDLLGHGSIAVTIDLYGHTSDQSARAAIDGLDGVLGL